MSEEPGEDDRKLERRARLAAVAVGITGLILVWFVVDTLWAKGWSMHIIHLTAILGAAVVTLAVSLIVVLVVMRFRRILERKNRELQRLAAIGETVAGLVHYQKNLLNGLRGGLYIANGGLQRGDSSRLDTGWRMLRSSVLRIEQLTMNMLYCAKERDPKPELTDLNQLVREVYELMQETAANHEVELHEELAQDLGQHLLDRSGVFRAVLNLVGNAIDACVEARGEGVVIVRTGSTANEVLLAVQDNGCGMSRETMSKLFGRFYSTKGGQGTGLGLVVVKEVAEKHGGAIEVESEPGKGSLFRLRFPSAPSFR